MQKMIAGRGRVRIAAVCRGIIDVHRSLRLSICSTYPTICKVCAYYNCDDRTIATSHTPLATAHHLRTATTRRGGLSVIRGIRFVIAIFLWTGFTDSVVYKDIY